jgi:hypothetical protein
MTPHQLPAILAAFAKANEERDYLVVSRSEPPLPLERLFPDDSTVQWLCHIQTADDLVAVNRVDLGIVFDQLEHMEKRDGEHLLSRLRDQYCRRVLLHCRREIHSVRDLLALGYMEQESPSRDGPFFLFDPELFYEQRDWNSPAKWANPENFKKYRW